MTTIEKTLRMGIIFLLVISGILWMLSLAICTVWSENGGCSIDNKMSAVGVLFVVGFLLLFSFVKNIVGKIGLKIEIVQGIYFVVAAAVLIYLFVI